MCAHRAQAEFHPARQVTDADVSDLVRKIRSRVLRFLHSKGRLNDIDGADSTAPDASLLDTLRAAAILGKTALGPQAGRDDPRVGQGTQRGRAATNETRSERYGGSAASHEP